MNKTTAVIEDIEIYTDKPHFVRNFDKCHSISDLKIIKPVHDSDIILVRGKTASGEKVSDIFNVLLRYDGTLEPDSLLKASRLRRERFVSLLKYYKITDDVRKYSVPKRMKELKGKKVEIVSYMGQDQIFIPQHTARRLKLKGFH